jgi:hypothetical protein
LGLERRVRSESGGLYLDVLSFILSVLLLSLTSLASPASRFRLCRISIRLYYLVKSRGPTIVNSTGKHSSIIMVSPSSSLLDFSDNDAGEHEYQGHPGDYSARMDELFADQSEGDEEGSPSRSPRSGSARVTKATYREQLRDVLGSEAAGEDDDLDHSVSHGNAFSDDEHPAQSTSDPQRPVSLTTPPCIHADAPNTLSTIGNSRRACRSCLIGSAILSTIHNILTGPICLSPPWSPEHESPISSPNDVPTTVLPHTSALTAKFHHYFSFTTIKRTLARIVTLLRALEWSAHGVPTGGGPGAAWSRGFPMDALERDLKFCLFPEGLESSERDGSCGSGHAHGLGC